MSHLRWPRLAFAPRSDPPVGHRFLIADALRQSVDVAWDVWHSMSGGSSDSGLVCPSAPHGGWTLGASAAQVRSLVSARSVALGAGDAQGAEAAHRSRADLRRTCEVDRLKTWRTRMTNHAAGARWVRRRVLAAQPVARPSLGSMSTFDARSRSFAEDLAHRWNAQIFRVSDGARSFSISPLGGVSGHDVVECTEAPVARFVPALPVFPVPALPEFRAPPPWTAEDVQRFAPTGSAGPDGWSHDHLAALPEWSVEHLLALLASALRTLTAFMPFLDLVQVVHVLAHLLVEVLHRGFLLLLLQETEVVVVSVFAEIVPGSLNLLLVANIICTRTR